MSPSRPGGVTASRPRDTLAVVRVKNKLRLTFPFRGDALYRQAAEFLVEHDPHILDGPPAAVESATGIINAVATPSTMGEAIAAINGEIHRGELWQYVASVALQSDPKDFHDFIIGWLCRKPENRKQHVRRRILEADGQQFSSKLLVLDDLLVLIAVLLGGADLQLPETPLLLHAIGGRLRTLHLGPAALPAVAVFPFDEPIRSLAKALADDADALSKLRWCRGRCLLPHECRRGGPLFLDGNRRTNKHPTIACCDAHRQQVGAIGRRFYESLKSAASPDSGGLAALGQSDKSL